MCTRRVPAGSMAEWLRRLIRNQLGVARGSSNLSAVAFLFCCDLYCTMGGREFESAARPVGWPSGLRRQFKALVSSEAWVRIPLQSLFFLFFSFFFSPLRLLLYCHVVLLHPQ